MNIYISAAAAVRVFLALAAIALSPFPATAFQFPAADAVEIVNVPDEYAGDVWAVAYAEPWTESKNTVWSRCEAVGQSYGDPSLTGTYTCLENVAEANRTTLSALGHLKAGASIILPMTRAEANALDIPVDTNTATLVSSDIAALTGEIAKLARNIESLRAENGREDNPVEAFSTHLDDSFAELSRRIENLGPKIEAAFSDNQNSSGALTIALIVALVVIGGLLVGGLFERFSRRKHTPSVIVDSEELAAMLAEKNEKFLKRFAMGHEHLAKLANGVNVVADKLREERARADELQEEIAKLKDKLAGMDLPFEEEQDYEFDGKTYTVTLKSASAAGKVYRTPFAESVLESNLKSHFKKNVDKPQLAVAAE